MISLDGHEMLDGYETKYLEKWGFRCREYC